MVEALDEYLEEVAAHFVPASVPGVETGTERDEVERAHARLLRYLDYARRPPGARDADEGPRRRSEMKERERGQGGRRRGPDEGTPVAKREPDPDRDSEGEPEADGDSDGRPGPREEADSRTQSDAGLTGAEGPPDPEGEGREG